MVSGKAAGNSLNNIHQNQVILAEDSNWHVLDNELITSSDTVNIGGKKVKLTNVEKELWPGVAKANLIEYYHSVAPYILPYLENRPQSLHIKHIKPLAPGMYIKDMEGRHPKWLQFLKQSENIRKRVGEM